ncbi:unnamed protein product, partial [marine sediment metagenome]
VKLGQTTFPELAVNLGKVVPLASTLKIETAELFGVFATLTGVTGNASEVATQFRGVLAATAKPTEDLTNLMHSLGYESATAAIEQKGLAGYYAIEEWLIKKHKLLAAYEKELMDFTGCARPGGGDPIIGFVTGIEKESAIFTYELTNLERVT